jgi:hypothetical protein
MVAVLEGLARLVTRRPVAVVAAVLVLTGALGALAGQAVNEQGVAVENDLTQALTEIDDRFGQAQSVVQVVIRTTGGRDVRNATAVRTVMDIASAVAGSDAAPTLIRPGQQPPVVSYLDGVILALASQSRDAATLTDEEVLGLIDASARLLPPEFSGLLGGARGDR